jgi:hypothetical protein
MNYFFKRASVGITTLKLVMMALSKLLFESVVMVKNFLQAEKVVDVRRVAVGEAVG